MAITTTGGGSSSKNNRGSSSLAPGFRFHPTDEELVRYYLRRKICGRPFRVDAISDVDVYKLEPWDLPMMSRLQTRDLEWYFFTGLDKKYGNGSRTNRATERGYWKTTGKDRSVFHNSKEVGMKKTLVYHEGRAPRGTRTNWVMHEYRLIDEEVQKAGFAMDAVVLCRIFRKSGLGPKSGERYGAPFVDEEWEDDELVMFPKEEHAEEVPIDDDAYLDADDLEQILGTDIPEEDNSLPANYDPIDGYYIGATTEDDCAPRQLTALGESQSLEEQSDEVKLLELPAQNEVDGNLVKHEFICEPSNSENPLDVDFLLDEPLFDVPENPSLDDRAFLEANDLKNAADGDHVFDMLDEYLTYFDASADNWQDNFDSFVGSQELTESASITPENMNQQVTKENQQLLQGNSGDIASSSFSEPDKQDVSTDIHYPFLGRASRMLGNIHAPPAFASEYPSKDASLHLTSVSSSPIRVTAGIVQLRNVTFTGAGVDWSIGKNGQLSIVLSFGLSQSDDDLIDSSKVRTSISRSWFYCIFMWVLILSMSFKMGSFASPRSFLS